MRLAKGRLALMVAMAGAAVAMLNAPAPLLAQSVNMSVVIPFDFHVGEKTLPSGTYIVQKQGEALKLSDSRGNSAFVMSTAVQNPAAKLESQLVFSRYGDECYLSEVRWIGYNSARGVIKSTKEIELAKTFSGRSVLAAGLTK